LKHLVSRETLQFWVLQTVIWLGYGVEQFLAGIGMGRPLGYYKLCLFDSVCGFVLTLIIRRWGGRDSSSDTVGFAHG
jgi:hypothetical protein